MHAQWPLQEAKNHLSQVIDEACRSGPQVITVRGRAKAVILSAEEFERLTRPSTFDLLAHLVVDETAPLLVRQGAVAGLGSLKDERALDVLLALVDTDLRRPVVAALQARQPAGAD